MPLDRNVFIRPIAHRGLHDPARGIIENTAEAFQAAIVGNFGIECDLRPAKCGQPVVFHDFDLSRLVEASGNTTDMTAAALGKLRYRDCDTRILHYGELLDLTAGKVPLLVEIKSEWEPPDLAYLHHIAQLTRTYKGPLALMSFDPAVMAVMRHLAPEIPRGIVAGGYRIERNDDWWQDKLDWRERLLLRHLLRSFPSRPSFFNYHVKSLPTPATTIARRVLAIPLFVWTVRTQADRAAAEQHGDAMVFEGFVP